MDNSNIISIFKLIVFLFEMGNFILKVYMLTEYDKSKKHSRHPLVQINSPFFQQKKEETHCRPTDPISRLDFSQQNKIISLNCKRNINTITILNEFNYHLTWAREGDS